MSNPTWPVYTFRINLETPGRQSSILPNRTTTDGNETVSEADNMKNTRSTWLSTYFGATNFIFHKDNETFTVYGQQAQYIKDTYITGSRDDILILVG